MGDPIPKLDPDVHAEPDDSLPSTSPETEEDALPPVKSDPQDAAKAQENATREANEDA